MAEVRRRPLKQGRLQQLASEAGLPAKPSQPPIHDDRSAVTFLAASHASEARDMLLWRRTWDAEYKKSSSFSSKSKEPVFGYDEVNRAIRAVVNENGSVGLTEALLDIIQERKGSMWDKMKGRDQIRWTELLSAATWNHNHDLLRLLASRTDEKSLNSVLPLALRNQDTPATRILLERGADLAEYHAEFMTVISGTNGELAELLICAPRPPCHRCRSEALVIVVQKGSLLHTSLLVQTGVDTDWNDWAALRFAVQNRRREIILAIVSGSRPPRSASLDAALGLLYKLAGSDADFTSQAAEILLCSGAQGENTANVLVAVSRNRQLELLDLLISYGASVDFHDGEAIRNAILEKDAQTLVHLLRGKPTPLTLSKALMSTQEALLADLKYAKDVAGKLLSAGLGGEAVDMFLHRVVLLICTSGPRGQHAVMYMDGLELARMLVDGNHTDINFRNGESLRAAAGMACLDVLRLLLGKSPAESSLSAAFAEATKISLDNPRRLEVLSTLLDAGACGMVVDQALVSAVQQARRGLEEAKVLLRVASLDYDQGAALRTAISQKEIEHLDPLLAERRYASSTLRYAWDCAATLGDSRYQYEVYRRLLEADLSAAPVDRELVAAVGKGSDSLPICELLLAHGARVEAGDGLPLAAAVSSQNMKGLTLLLEKKPPPALLRTAAQNAWLLPESARLEFAHVLLTQGLEQYVLDSGLLFAISEESYSMGLITMLLDFNASPEFKQGESIAKAVLKSDPELLETLVARVVDPENLRNALAALLSQPAWNTGPGLSLLSCLLAHGATGPLIDPAFVQSCASYNSDAYQILISHLSSEAVLTEALHTIIMQNLAWQLPDGLALVEILLSHGASGAILRPAFVQAASVFNIPAVLLLKNYVRDVDIYTIAWGEATLTNNEWLEETSVPVLETLLTSGAKVDADFALLEAVASSAGGREFVGPVDLLLWYGADVNYNGAQPLRLAAENGNATLIKMFSQHELGAEAIWLAFFDIITGRAREDPAQALVCLRSLAECLSARLELNSAPEGMDLPLIQVLSKYPSSPELVLFLIQAGADVMSKAACPLLLAGPDDWRGIGSYRQGEIGPAGLYFTEEIPALLWALMRPKGELDDAVAEILIDLGADVNFATPHLRFTALILAAKHDRPSIVSKLLQNGALRDARDNFQNTALFYAARHGYDDCVEHLIWQPAAVNDGSLHEAARNLHTKTVELLIRAGHDPNFASEMHGGRTALGELCMLADGRTSAEELDGTLRALASGGANPLAKSGSMPPIFLALVNKDPKPIVEMLVGRVMYGKLDHPGVILECDQLAYSPTMYLKKLILPSAGHMARAKRLSSAEYQKRAGPYPADTSLEVYDTPDVSRAFHVSTTTVYHELLNLLVRHGAKDRFYYTGTELVQPVDMVGAPDYVTRSENARRQRMETLRASPGDPRAPPRPAKEPMMQRPGGNDELHIWGPTTQAASVSNAQLRLTEEKRQVQDRRALAELVNQHMAQQQELRKSAERLRLEAQNKQRLDHEMLQTEWSASQAGLASRSPGERSQSQEQAERWSRKHSETIQSIAAGRQARWVEHERARERSFIEDEEKRIARRPEGGSAAIRSTALARPVTPGLKTISVAVEELSIDDAVVAPQGA